jgi:hypothetical protein
VIGGFGAINIWGKGLDITIWGMIPYIITHINITNLSYTLSRMIISNNYLWITHLFLWITLVKSVDNYVDNLLVTC